MMSDKDVVRVDEAPFDERIPIEQLKGPAKKWFKKKYKDKNNTYKKIVNTNTGNTIEISGKGIAHTISRADNIDVIYSMDVLPEMIERMEYAGHFPPNTPKDGKPVPTNFLGVEKYHTQVQVRGKLYTAEFVIKMERMGKQEIGKVGKVRLYHYNHTFTKGPSERTA